VVAGRDVPANDLRLVQPLAQVRQQEDGHAYSSTRRAAAVIRAASGM
jgi:hypothetical protein